MKFQILLAACLIAPIHGAVLFSDDFESPVVSGAYQTFSLGQSFNGWNVTAGNVDLVGSGYWPGGGQVVDLNGTTLGEIQRTISTTLDQKYEITFEIRPNGGNYAEASLTWSGTTFSFKQTTVANDTYQISRIVLGSGSDLMTFRGGNLSGTTGLMINNLVISTASDEATLSTSGLQNLPAVVPEPHEYAMIAGLGLCAFAAWRKRVIQQAA